MALPCTGLPVTGNNICHLTPTREEVKALTKYWIEEFDWRTVEKKLNAIPQFKTEIKVEGFDPIDIHFVHQKSDVKGAIPLLFLHGWPGSFLEVTKMLPLLKGEDGKQAFHVVAPSLPNYGFSGRVTKVGDVLVVVNFIDENRKDSDLVSTPRLQTTSC